MNKMRDNKISSPVERVWDLVKSPDGYGIVTSLEERTVFMGNGLEMRLSSEEWDKLEVFPLNPGAIANSNFVGVCNKFPTW